MTRVHECPFCAKLYDCEAFDDHLANDPECGRDAMYGPANDHDHEICDMAAQDLEREDPGLSDDWSIDPEAAEAEAILDRQREMDEELAREAEEGEQR